MPVKSSNKTKFYKTKGFWIWLVGGVVGFGGAWLLLNIELISIIPTFFYLTITFVIAKFMSLINHNYQCGLLCLPNSKGAILVYKLLMYIYFVYIAIALKQIIKKENRKLHSIILSAIILASILGIYFFYLEFISGFN